MKIGTIVMYRQNTDILSEFKKLKELDMSVCQLNCWDASLHTRERAEEITAACRETGVTITALWAGWSGPKVWDFLSGPQTLGLVPPAYRHKRMEELVSASDFAEMLGVTDVVTHVGFIPENPNDPDFAGVVAAVSYVANYMKNKGQYFLFETGQETPVTMLRAIEAIGTGNLGINLDTANLILYGKANTADSLDVFGKYVRNTHIKDGLYPTCGSKLGLEVALGQGLANIPLVIKKMKSLGLDVPLIIEREISGDEQTRDIIAARDMLLSLI